MPSASMLTQRRSAAAVEAATASVPVRPRGKAKRPEKTLKSWKLLPDYLRDNEFIIKHYRVDYSLRDSILSMFRLHNETGNIWTHLIGFLLFVALTVAIVYLRPTPLVMGREMLSRLESNLLQLGRVSVAELKEVEQRLLQYGVSGLKEFQQHAAEVLNLQKKLQQYGVSNMRELEMQVLKHGRDGLHHLGAELVAIESQVLDFARTNWRALRSIAATLDVHWPVPRWPAYVFTAGAMTCLLTSTVCHLLGCCSKHVSAVIWRIDYAGITVLIVASFYPPVYYGFLCLRHWQLIYLSATTIMGAITLCASLMPVFQTREWRPWRAGMYAALGCWGFVPLTHGALYYWGVPEVMQVVKLDAIMGAIYLSGAAIYALRVPERWAPGKFDLAFHSHQLFHVAVVIAACVHYQVVMLLLRWRDSTACPMLEA